MVIAGFIESLNRLKVCCKFIDSNSWRKQCTATTAFNDGAHAMNKEMKHNAARRGIIAALSILTLAPIASVQAVGYETTGAVALIRSHDTSLGSNFDWFTLQGVTSAGMCGTDSGLVVFRIKDDARGQRHFAMLLAARHAGTPVTVSVDDANRDAGGFCYVRWIG